MVIGDRPDTDGAFAGALGWRFALVLSGVTAAADLPVEPSPDVVAVDLAALVDELLVRTGGDFGALAPIVTAHSQGSGGRDRSGGRPTTPKAKPPTWATHATPLFGLVKNCRTNQNPSNHSAPGSR